MKENTRRTIEYRGIGITPKAAVGRERPRALESAMSLEDFVFYFMWGCARWVQYGSGEATKEEIRNALFVSWCCELKEREEQK